MPVPIRDFTTKRLESLAVAQRLIYVLPTVT